MKWGVATTLSELRPTSKFAVTDDLYSGITWDASNSASKPTESEINSKMVELDNAEPMRLLRIERTRLLTECDWTQGADVPNSIKTAWQTYRQQLRDLPASASPKLDDFYELDLSSVIWPSKPS